MLQWVVWFIVADLVITGVVIYLVMSGRLKMNVGFKLGQDGVSFPALMSLTKDSHPRIGEYLRANWSGAPEHLPQVLESLLGELERDARQRGMTVDRDTLKTMLASSVRSHRLVRGGDLEDAIQRIA